jgi:hypothetical protein
MKTSTTARENRAKSENAMLVCTGTFFFKRNDDNSISYGFKNLHYWNGNRQVHLHPNDEDKFIVTEDYGDYDTARSEFWSRWQIFCEKRFQYPYIKIEKL